MNELSATKLSSFDFVSMSYNFFCANAKVFKLKKVGNLICCSLITADSYYEQPAVNMVIITGL